MNKHEIMKCIRSTLKDMSLADVFAASAGSGTSVWAMTSKNMRQINLDTEKPLPDTDSRSEVRKKWYEDFSEG